MKKWSRFFDSGTRKPIFGHLKMGTFAKSAHFQVPKNGTSSARIQNLRPLFHANIPPKWWSRCLFYSFTTFERVISEFNIGNLFSNTAGKREVQMLLQVCQNFLPAACACFPTFVVMALILSCLQPLIHLVQHFVQLGRFDSIRICINYNKPDFLLGVILGTD